MVPAAPTAGTTRWIFGGCSAGANLAAAVGLLRGAERGATVAMLVCDSGLEYLSTDLYPFDPTP